MITHNYFKSNHQIYNGDIFQPRARVLNITRTNRVVILVWFLVNTINNFQIITLKTPRSELCLVFVGWGTKLKNKSHGLGQNLNNARSFIGPLGEVPVCFPHIRLSEWLDSCACNKSHTIRPSESLQSVSPLQSDNWILKTSRNKTKQKAHRRK